MSPKVTVDGIGTAAYTAAEYRNVRRMLEATKGTHREEEGLNTARMIHEAKVLCDATLETGREDLRPLPDELGEQLALA